LATANTLTAAGGSTKEIGFAVLDQASGTAAPGGATTDFTVRVRLVPTGFTPVGSADLDPSVLQKAVVALTAAQIMGMNAAPVNILPAPAAGQALVIDQIVVEVKPGLSNSPAVARSAFRIRVVGLRHTRPIFRPRPSLLRRRVSTFCLFHPLSCSRRSPPV
jgi:hypothetical protein